MSQTTIDQRRPNELRPHPMNEEVYGDRADADLIESVRTKGVLNPILITTDNLIVSGHRRWGAAIAAGLQSVPVVIAAIDDPLAIEEALIESNRQRQKTNEQIGREYKHLKHIYNERQSRQGTNQHTVDRASTSREANPKPTVRAATELGVSQPTAVRIETVVNHIDHLQSNGHADQAEQLRQTLNRSANAAYNTVRSAAQPTKTYQSEVVAAPASRHLTPTEIQAVIWRAIQHAGHTTPAAQLAWLTTTTIDDYRPLLNPGVIFNPDDPDIFHQIFGLVRHKLQRQITATTPPPHNSHESHPSHPPATDPVEATPLSPPRPHVTNNSGNNEWYTPAPIANAARSVLGAIDLDPASCVAANEVIKAERFYGIGLDGLTQPWFGRIWLNPPYASDLIGKFVEKLTYHLNSEDITEAIVLVNNATETAWFQEIAAYASAVCFPKGRIKYWNPDRPDALSPLQGQAILYIGPSNYKFRSVFSDFGVVL